MHVNSSLAFLALIFAFPGPVRSEDAIVFRSGDLDRKYLQYIGQADAPGPKPLLLYLHGARPPEWKNVRWPQLTGLADEHGLVVLNPEAVGFRWNYADADHMQSESARVDGKFVDDVGFLSTLIDDRIAAGIVDPKRVYVLGDSRGGMMSYQLACQISGKIAAIGPMIAAMTEGQLKSCKPTRPIAVMAINGTMDDNIFYDGWLRGGKRQASVPEVMDFWRKFNGCGDQKGDVVTRRVGNDQDRTNVWRINWLGCRPEAPVRLYRVNGGGHRIPSFEPDTDDARRQFGRRNGDISGVQEFWSFAAQLRLN